MTEETSSQANGEAKVFETIRYDVSANGVADVVLNRPEVRNAQDRRMTYELNAAFDLAIRDDAVKVIVLSGEGPHFCAGHDMKDTATLAEFAPIGTSSGFDRPGAEGLVAFEEEVYLGMCRRWRDLSKPVIAQVHGKTMGGGLMLLWIADLIIASADAEFSDPVIAFGMCGVEYLLHPWELGARKAKELLFTGDFIGAEEARALGMVNRVVPRDDLRTTTVELAERIATRQPFALKLIKQSVNRTLDIQGQADAVNAAFALHQLNHSHNQQVFGAPIDPTGVPAALRGAALRLRQDEGGW